MDENMQNNNGMPQQEKKGLAIASMVLGITSMYQDGVFLISHLY
jgi:hypothetical protein